MVFLSCCLIKLISQRTRGLRASPRQVGHKRWASFGRHCRWIHRQASDAERTGPFRKRNQWQVTPWVAPCSTLESYKYLKHLGVATVACWQLHGFWACLKGLVQYAMGNGQVRNGPFVALGCGRKLGPELSEMGTSDDTEKLRFPPKRWRLCEVLLICVEHCLQLFHVIWKLHLVTPPYLETPPSSFVWNFHDYESQPVG